MWHSSKLDWTSGRVDMRSNSGQEHLPGWCRPWAVVQWVHPGWSTDMSWVPKPEGWIVQQFGESFRCIGFSRHTLWLAWWPRAHAKHSADSVNTTGFLAIPGSQWLPGRCCRLHRCHTTHTFRALAWPDEKPGSFVVRTASNAWCTISTPVVASATSLSWEDSGSHKCKFECSCLCSFLSAAQCAVGTCIEHHPASQRVFGTSFLDSLPAFTKVVLSQLWLFQGTHQRFENSADSQCKISS